MKVASSNPAPATKKISQIQRLSVGGRSGWHIFPPSIRPISRREADRRSKTPVDEPCSEKDHPLKKSSARRDFGGNKSVNARLTCCQRVVLLPVVGGGRAGGWSLASQ
jgi:hypothetical protein